VWLIASNDCTHCAVAAPRQPRSSRAASAQCGHCIAKCAEPDRRLRWQVSTCLRSKARVRRVCTHHPRRERNACCAQPRVARACTWARRHVTLARAGDRALPAPCACARSHNACVQGCSGGARQATQRAATGTSRATRSATQGANAQRKAQMRGGAPRCRIRFAATRRRRDTDQHRRVAQRRGGAARVAARASRVRVSTTARMTLAAVAGPGARVRRRTSGNHTRETRCDAGPWRRLREVRCPSWAFKNAQCRPRNAHPPYG
jgi:hypothetical protein